MVRITRYCHRIGPGEVLRIGDTGITVRASRGCRTCQTPCRTTIVLEGPETTRYEVEREMSLDILRQDVDTHNIPPE
jgi:hypothetical protein